MTTDGGSFPLSDASALLMRLHLAGEEMEACNAISTALFPHQRVALAWMVGHENTGAEGMVGGILADDMVDVA